MRGRATDPISALPRWAALPAIGPAKRAATGQMLGVAIGQVWRVAIDQILVAATGRAEIDRVRVEDGRQRVM
ncbi:MAG: hypothetical protein AB7O62_20845 [Pirellulales bacterium]